MNRDPSLRASSLNISRSTTADAGRTVEYRFVERYSQPVADLERSQHVAGAAWRNWKLVAGALPIEIARIRAECGNGIISNAERTARESDWHKAQAKRRRAALAAAKGAS